MANVETDIEAILHAQDADNAFAAFSRSVGRYGYDNACYTLLTDHPSIGQEAFHGLQTSYPKDWIKFYVEQNYQQDDPVWLRLLDRPIPFFWQDAVEEFRRDNAASSNTLDRAVRVMNEAADSGVTDGIGISFVSKAGEIAGIGISKERAEQKKNYRDLSEIFLISTTLHDKIQSAHIGKMLPHLTPREIDVLSWAAEGLDDYQTSEKLGIRHATVRFHWNGLFKKMGVQNRTAAVVKAIRHGIISPQRLGP